MLLPPGEAPPTPYYKTHNILGNYEPISTKFQRFVTYLCDMQWLKKNCNMLLHHGVTRPPHIPHFSKYMISLTIDNGYLQNFQVMIY